MATVMFVQSESPVQVYETRTWYSKLPVAGTTSIGTPLTSVIVTRTAGCPATAGAAGNSPRISPSTEPRRRHADRDPASGAYPARSRAIPPAEPEPRTQNCSP